MVSNCFPLSSHGFLMVSCWFPYSFLLLSLGFIMFSYVFLLSSIVSFGFQRFPMISYAFLLLCDVSNGMILIVSYCFPYGLPFFLSNSYGFLSYWFSCFAYGFLWFLIDFLWFPYGFRWFPHGSNCFRIVSLVPCCSPWFLIHFLWFPYGLSWFPYGLPWFLLASCDFPRFLLGTHRYALWARIVISAPYIMRELCGNHTLSLSPTFHPVPSFPASPQLPSVSLTFILFQASHHLPNAWLQVPIDFILISDGFLMTFYGSL